jgi:hypothetical protein
MNNAKLLIGKADTASAGFIWQERGMKINKRWHPLAERREENDILCLTNDGIFFLKGGKKMTSYVKQTMHLLPERREENDILCLTNDVIFFLSTSDEPGTVYAFVGFNIADGKLL